MFLPKRNASWPPASPARSQRKSCYDVRVNRDHACQCTHDDVAGLPPGSAKPNQNQIPARRMPQQGVDPMREILGFCDKLAARLAKIFDDLGLDLPEPVAPTSESPIDQILAVLRWLDAGVTVAEYHASGLERATPPRASPQRADIYQPRGEEAKNSVVSNMGNLTFGPEHMADAPATALAQKAHGLGPAPSLKASEARSMTSPPRAPAGPLEDRYQRGESRPRELIDTFPKGNPYRAGGMSAAPDAPAPQNASARASERTRLDRTTGATKYAFSQTYPTGDRAPSTGDLIRALSRKEREMMRQIQTEISTVMKARWH
jgi:hypothetical protein